MSEIQQKIYDHLERLQKLTSEIPAELQQRIPNELLSDIARCLVEGPIYEIVSSLTEVQNGTEKQLFRERLQMLRGHSGKVFFHSQICIKLIFLHNLQRKSSSFSQNTKKLFVTIRTVQKC